MRVFVFCVLLSVGACTTSLTTSIVDMCDSKNEVHLQGYGEASSLIVSLNPWEGTPECTLHVTAPKRHVVNLQFIESEDTKPTYNGSDQESSPSCVMTIFLPDNNHTPFWKGDPCSKNVLPDIDLLTNDFKIQWTPPDDPWNARGRKFLVTAVGSGSVCKEPFQYTCMRIGRIPMLCVTNHLLCDGYKNCPKGSPNSDEDETLCKNRVSQNAWKKLIVELYKNYRPAVPEESWTLNSTDSTEEWLEILKNNVTKKTPPVYEENHNASETISVMLNKYGPWGYIMLGLLICGTVLFFCGLWECCCRQQKTDIEPPPPSQPTTVLIVNCDQGENVSQPPNYDELDAPPSYLTLFPNFKQSTSNGRNCSESSDNVATTSDNSDNIERIDEGRSQ